jgi:hypothetical protein
MSDLPPIHPIPVDGAFLRAMVGVGARTVRTLDAWSRKHAPGTIDFIWADVQGAEGDLVRGGNEALRRTRFLYTEFNDDELYEGQATLRDLLGMLPDFEIVRRYDDDVLLRNTAVDRTILSP